MTKGKNMMHGGGGGFRSPRHIAERQRKAKRKIAGTRRRTMRPRRPSERRI
jgi:hypothetical protein